jgi:hypothetical protein
VEKAPMSLLSLRETVQLRIRYWNAVLGNQDATASYAGGRLQAAQTTAQWLDKHPTASADDARQFLVALKRIYVDKENSAEALNPEFARFNTGCSVETSHLLRDFTGKVTR